ncbi:hypothetical protein SAMN00120144_0253 [Hymenobacter roseosalivarius DSM 11622]|uniref:CN hydrolase domain-containing protein n=1 Tax=Hymenobacter roseosalivarius DSM 11622 TaxID=645990 RepID=A0A1W1W365_9BACT|nr:nitrilase-related carbon-nitrogen hydrolase [Hymenobacter roseosalivarius]SMB99544.1 hypothetical protein SAMN00120144_0253 [Hymenobacter roseosalivarius DSM 11622]
MTDASTRTPPGKPAARDALGLVDLRDLPAELEPAGELRGNPDAVVLSGGSVIIGPDGAILAGPVYDVETILTAEIDLARIPEEQLTLDVTGHYARPDVFGPA